MGFDLNGGDDKVIRNYGLLWQRDYVHLGGAGNKGTLLGRRSPKAAVVDFREQIGVYVLYDKDLFPVYVGQAGNGNANLFSRLKTHTNDHLWNRWEYFTWFGLRGVNSVGGKLTKFDHVDKVFKTEGGRILNLLEGALIAAMEPKLNKQGSRFDGVERYIQEVDDDVLELTLEDVVSEIGKLHTAIGKLDKKLSR